MRVLDSLGGSCELLAIKTGGAIEGGYLYVLDVDRRRDGMDVLESLPALPETVTAKTRDGFHYWFRTSEPMRTRYLDNGLELKGKGSYVCVPPGEGRSWVRNPFEFEVAECPAWLLELAAKPPSWLAQSKRKKGGQSLGCSWQLPDSKEACLALIASAQEGWRTEALLRCGAKALSLGATEKDLRIVCLQNGLTEDREEKTDEVLAYLLSTNKKTHTTYLIILPTLEKLPKSAIEVLDFLRLTWEKREGVYTSMGCEYVAGAIGIPKSTVSRHLIHFEKSGLIYTRQGKVGQVQKVKDVIPSFELREFWKLGRAA
jgi:hypothetical protein